MLDESSHLLQTFDEAVTNLTAHLHPQWNGRCAWSALPTDRRSARPLVLVAWRRLCGTLPQACALQDPLGRWCLLPRTVLLQRMAVLALARRPGLVRGCLRRADREALEALAGPALASLRELSASAPPLSPVAGSLTLDHWAWTGYLDLTRARAWPSRSLRRWARLALPPVPVGSEPAVNVRLAPLDEVSRVDAWMALS